MQRPVRPHVRPARVASGRAEPRRVEPALRARRWLLPLVAGERVDPVADDRRELPRVRNRRVTSADRLRMRRADPGQLLHELSHLLGHHRERTLVTAAEMPNRAPAPPGADLQRHQYLVVELLPLRGQELPRRDQSRVVLRDVRPGVIAQVLLQLRAPARGCPLIPANPPDRRVVGRELGEQCAVARQQ